MSGVLHGGIKTGNGLLAKAMKNTRMSVALISLALFVAFPLLFSNPAVTGIAVFALIFAGAAMGWNIFSGFTGYISLGHAAYYGIGAYMLALMCQIWHIPGGIIPFLLLPVVGILTSVCSLLLGWIALKTRRFAFLVITIAIFSVVTQLPNLLTGVISGISILTMPIPQWSAAIYNVPFYYIALLLLLVAFGVSWWIRHSRYGLNLLAIRDDEARAEGLGLKVGTLKLSAYMISACFVGIAGAMTVYFIGFIAPTSAFDRTLNIAIPLMVFVGGTGTVWGPIIGAFIVVVLQQYLTLQFGTQDWDLILYGVLLLTIILVLPEGIVPTLARRWAARKSVSNTANSEEIWIKANIEKVISAVSSYATVAPSQSLATQDLRKIIANDIAQIQPSGPLPALIQSSGPLPALIPHRHIDEPTANKGLTQRVRSQRLISLPPGVSEKIAASSQPPNVMPPLVGWPCPRCNAPLLAWGDMHFCKQCGLKLSRPQKQTVGLHERGPINRPTRNT